MNIALLDRCGLLRYFVNVNDKLFVDLSSTNILLLAHLACQALEHPDKAYTYQCFK